MLKAQAISMRQHPAENLTIETFLLKLFYKISLPLYIFGFQYSQPKTYETRQQKR